MWPIRQVGKGAAGQGKPRLQGEPIRVLEPRAVLLEEDRLPCIRRAPAICATRRESTRWKAGLYPSWSLAVSHCAATACLADRATTSYRLAPRHSAQPFQQSVRPVRYISYSPTTYATICLSVPRLLFAIRIRKRSNRRDRFDPKTASRARAYHCVPDLRPPRWRSIPVK